MSRSSTLGVKVEDSGQPRPDEIDEFWTTAPCADLDPRIRGGYMLGRVDEGRGVDGRPSPAMTRAVPLKSSRIPSRRREVERPKDFNVY
jgi:hypothetical protein